MQKWKLNQKPQAKYLWKLLLNFSYGPGFQAAGDDII
jgi:hypothetical protein